ncbi:flagellar hook-length control protein FliK [Aquicoccus sp. G2-2]|uniref:flagellar hook-length control protein FliK n=1 Tax=Aquicoccus sp. G2-2 TaxID=3092120 RepID=UPI002ADFC0AA|nr:flagellar hook-length control protein FliK [Aquicoccus sp. G2-2]MEA1115026.1 flagellar hook-length control protein FliK [Aquicoccus sp. G2-2]
MSTLDSAATVPGAPTAPPDAAKTLHATRGSTNAGAALKGIPAGKQNDPLPNGTDTPAFNLTPIADPTGAIKPGPALPTASSLRPDLAHHAAQQIASTISHSAPGQPVVLRLNPDELGHVRLALHAADGAVSLAIHVERGDTLDLMRRHIGQLATAFREIGYSDVAFSFSSSERDHSHPQPSTPAADALISEIAGERSPTQAETDTTPASNRCPASISASDRKGSP